MVTWLANLFPLQAMTVVAGIGLLILKIDRERMSSANLKREAAFSNLMGWLYIVTGVVGGFLGMLTAHLYRL